MQVFEKVHDEPRKIGLLWGFRPGVIKLVGVFESEADAAAAGVAYKKNVTTADLEYVAEEVAVDGTYPERGMFSRLMGSEHA